MSDQIAMLNGLGGRGGRKSRKRKRGMRRNSGRRAYNPNDWDSEGYSDYFDMAHTDYKRGRNRKLPHVGRKVPGVSWAGLGVGESAGGIGGMTIILLGAVAIGAFIIIKKMGDDAESAGGGGGGASSARTASSYKQARDAYVARTATYTKSLYE